MIFWATVLPTEARGSEVRHETPSPWLVISSDKVNARWPIVQAVPLTSKVDKKDGLARILIAAEEITPFTGVAKVLRRTAQLALTEQTRPLAHDRLEGDPIAEVSLAALLNVEAGVRYMLGF